MGAFRARALTHPLNLPPPHRRLPSIPPCHSHAATSTRHPGIVIPPAQRAESWECQHAGLAASILRPWPGQRCLPRPAARHGESALPGEGLAPCHHHRPPAGHRECPPTPQGWLGQWLAPGIYGPQTHSLAHPSQAQHAAGKPVSSAQKLIRIPQNTPKFCPTTATQSLDCPHRSTSPKHLDLASPPYPQEAMLWLGRGRNQGASPQPPNSLLPARCRAGSRWSLSARPHGTARGTWAWEGTAQLLRLRCPAPARAPRPHSHLPGGFGLPQGHMPAVPGLSHVTQAGDTHTC